MKYTLIFSYLKSWCHENVSWSEIIIAIKGTFLVYRFFCHPRGSLFVPPIQFWKVYPDLSWPIIVTSLRGLFDEPGQIISTSFVYENLSFSHFRCKGTKPELPRPFWSCTFQMPPHHGDWKARAEAKVADTLSKIPVEWRLEQDVIDAAKNRRQLTGDFIFDLLDRETIQIISHDSKELVDFIGRKEYTSLEVAQAYCKTAAVAHQIVRKNRVSVLMDRSSVTVSSCWSLPSE